MPTSERQRNQDLRTCEHPHLRRGQNHTISNVYVSAPEADPQVQPT